MPCHMDMAVLRARFLLTCGHVVATCLIEMQAACVVAYLSFVMAVGSLFAGLDIFSPTKNAVHIFCHFVGGVLVCQMILHDLDPARYLWQGRQVRAVAGSLAQFTVHIRHDRAALHPQNVTSFILSGIEREPQPVQVFFAFSVV